MTCKLKLYYSASENNNTNMHMLPNDVLYCLVNMLSALLYFIIHTVHTFYQKSNHVISDFRMLDSFSFHKLHSTYCMSLYGCELFNYNSNYISELYVAWRKVIRKIFKFPMRMHNYIVYGIVESVNIILDRRIAKYIL